MFHLSTRGDYGLLFLSALAEKMRQGKSTIALKEVAAEKKLPLKYLSHIATALKDAGFITSKEGRDGGYSLARNAREISMMEVLQALEGPVAPVRCCNDKAKPCGSESRCGVKSAWQDAKRMMIEFLKTKTLEDCLKK